MKKKLLLTSILLTAAAFTTQAIDWDGGATTNDWDTGTNWDGDVAPTASDNAVFNVSTGLPSFGGVDVGTASVAADVTVDIATWALRADGTGTAVKGLTLDNLTFTSNFTNNAGAGQTFTNGANTDGLRLEFTQGNRSITNNSANAVVFDSGTDTRGFGISGVGDPVNLLLEGTGDFTWDRGRIFGAVDRFGTGDTFTGTFTVNTGHPTAAAFNMAVDLRAQGGTIDVNVSNAIGNGVNIALNDSVGVVDATIDLSGVTDDVGSLNSFSNGGILAVSGTTDILFADYNEGPVAITGFVTGRTELKFDAAAGTESLAGLTINAGAAAWLDLGGGTFALVPSATVSDPLILVSGEEALSDFTTATRGTTASASQTISVQGVNLTDDITVTAPSTSFEVSLDNITFSSDVTLTQSGGAVAAPVYIRLAAVAQGGDYSQNLLLESTGAVNRIVELSASVPAAALVWDGDNSALWASPANWDPDSLPGSVDDVTIDVSTSLPGFGGISVDSDALGVAEFGSLTVDLAAFAFRSAGSGGIADNIDAYGDITFTSTFTNDAGAGTTFRDGSPATGFLRLRTAVNTLNIVNNGTNPVVYGASATNAFGIASTGSGGAFVLLSGSGGHVWNDGTVFSGVLRFGLSDGTLTINGGNFIMGTDLRAEGGTITINASDIIGDSVNITLNDNVGAVDATIDFSGQSETAAVLNTFSSGGDLVVDGSTALTFTTFNNSSGTVDILGWSEGSSSIVFSTLGAPYNDTVADGTAFVGLTIGGATAYMIDIGGGAYEVSNSPTSGGSTAPPEFNENFSFDSGTGIASFSFPGVTGSQYVIERTFDLGATPIVWTNVYDSGVLGSDQTLTPTDTPGQPDAFYRMTVTP